MPADTVPSAASSFQAEKRCEAARRSPICSARCRAVQFLPAYHATPDDIFATIPIGAHWNVLVTDNSWFNSFTFRASDLILAAAAKTVQLLFTRC